MSDVPPNRRMYIREEETAKYTKLGIKVYRGPRGGLYVDLNDLIHAEKDRSVKNDYGELEKVLKTKKLSEISAQVFESIRYDKNYIESIKKELVKNIKDGFSEENIKEISVKLKVANGMRVTSYAKTISGDISDIIIDEEELNVDSYNSEKMKIFILRDGSRIFAKELDGNDVDDVRRIAVINNYIASYLLRMFTDNDIYRTFLPHCKIVKIDGIIYSAMEEVFGMLGYEAVDSGVHIEETDFLKEFVVSGILTGLWDIHGHNFVIIPDESIIIPFDLDFVGALRDELLGTIGPMDLFDIFKVKGKIDFKDIADKIVAKHDKFDDKMEKIIDSLIEEIKDYLLEAGYNKYDFEDIKNIFMSHWELLRELKESYKKGEMSALSFLLSIGSDYLGYDGELILSKIAKNLEIRKSGKVPPEFRIYVSAWQAQRLRRNGIKVYRGPRGGLYIDSREARRKGVKVEQIEGSDVDSMLDNVVDVDKEKLDEMGNIVMKDTRAFLKVRSEFLKSADYLIEHMIDFKLGDRKQYIEHYRRAMNLAYVLNKGNLGRMSNNPTITKFKKIDFGSAGAKPGVINVSSMFVAEMPDGSKVYMKRVDRDSPWVVNSLTAPTVLKVLLGDEYSSFIPTPRIVSNEKEAYVGLSEVFGITAVDTSYEEPVKNVELFKKFLAAHYAIGVADVTPVNYFMDQLNGTFVQYDYDYTFMRGKDSAHISHVVEIFAKKYGFDAEEVKRMGIQMLIDNYDKIKVNLNILRKAVRLYVMPDDVRETFKDEIIRAEMFIDEVVRLGTNNLDNAIKYIER